MPVPLLSAECASSASTETRQHCSLCSSELQSDCHSVPLWQCSDSETSAETAILNTNTGTALAVKPPELSVTVSFQHLQKYCVEGSRSALCSNGTLRSLRASLYGCRTRATYRGSSARGGALPHHQCKFRRQSPGWKRPHDLGSLSYLQRLRLPQVSANQLRARRRRRRH